MPSLFAITGDDCIERFVTAADRKLALRPTGVRILEVDVLCPSNLLCRKGAGQVRPCPVGLKRLLTKMRCAQCLPGTVANMKTRLILGILLALNLVVLVGQLWPEGAPPFARVVNIVFLCATLLYFAALFKKAS